MIKTTKLLLTTAVIFASLSSATIASTFLTRNTGLFDNVVASISFKHSGAAVPVDAVINGHDTHQAQMIDNDFGMELTQQNVSQGVSAGIFLANAQNTIAFYQCASQSNCSASTGKEIGRDEFVIYGSDNNYVATPKNITISF